MCVFVCLVCQELLSDVCLFVWSARSCCLMCVFVCLVCQELLSDVRVCGLVCQELLSDVCVCLFGLPGVVV